MSPRWAAEVGSRLQDGAAWPPLRDSCESFFFFLDFCAAPGWFSAVRLNRGIVLALPAVTRRRGEEEEEERRLRPPAFLRAALGRAKPPGGGPAARPCSPVRVRAGGRPSMLSARRAGRSRRQVLLSAYAAASAHRSLLCSPLLSTESEQAGALLHYRNYGSTDQYMSFGPSNEEALASPSHY